MSTTPFMNLNLPTVSVTAGPDWATQLNTVFQNIDDHDHSSGKGVKVKPSGLDINSDLTMAANNLTNIRSLRLFEYAAALSTANDLACLYNVSGELYYNDGLGNQIQLTSGGGLNASSVGGIGGDYASSTASATYSSASKTYSFLQNTGVRGNVDVANVLIREATSGANAITLKSPTSLAAGYDLTLPGSLPASTLPLSVSSSGVVSTAQITTAQVADNAVTLPKLGARTVTTDGSDPGAGGVVISPSSGSASTTSTTFIDVTNLEVELTTTGRPIMLMLIGDGTGTGSFIQATRASTSAVSVDIRLQALRNSTVIDRFDTAAVGEHSPDVGLLPNTLMTAIPPSSVKFVDTPSAGTYTFKIQYSTSVSSAVVTNVRLLAYEM